MTDIIDFNKKREEQQPTEPPKETPHKYEFIHRDGGGSVVATGILSFNPVFAALVTDEGKLLYAVPMDNVASIRRIDE